MTTFNQRRLLEHQVETSFLLKPMNDKREGESKEEAAKRKAEEKRKEKLRKKKF